MTHCFFPATKAAQSQIAELFDFVWPTAAALWNLRWQVAGFLAEVPQSTPVQLNDRFAFGSSIKLTNLKKVCVDTTWSSQQRHLAGIVLTNAFSVYEHWADEILASVGMGNDKGKLFEFDDPSRNRGLRSTVATICTAESAVMKSAYYPIFAGSPKYSWSIIGNLMLCYRYFKELRNSQIHAGGRAGDKAETAYREFAPASTRSALGMRGDLIHDPIVRGDRVVLHLRGVVGFCDILFRIMVTVDAELSRSLPAEALLEERFKNVKLQSTFSGNPHRRHMQVINCCKKAGLPKPANIEAIRRFIVSKGLVSSI